MSAFEVNVTPTRLKTSKVRSEAREPVVVALGPFTPKAVVQYDDVPVTKTARRFLQIKNSDDSELKLFITKLPKAELNFSLEWATQSVETDAVVFLEMSWSPLAVVAGKETLQITDNLGRRKDVSIIFKSIPLKSTGPLAAAAKRNISQKVPNVPKKLKLKTPSPPKHFMRKSILVKKNQTSVTAIDNELFNCQLDSENERRLTKKINFNPELSYKSPLRAKNLNGTDIFQTDTMNFSNISIFDEMPASRPSSFTSNKENKSPVNASDIFDKLAFTPVNDATKAKRKDDSIQDQVDYLSSLPTPTSVIHRETFSFAVPELRKKLLVSPESQPTPRLTDTNDKSVLAHMRTPQAAEQPDLMETPQNRSDMPCIAFQPPLFSTVTKSKGPSAPDQIDEVPIKKHLFETPPNETFEVSPQLEEFSTPCAGTTIRTEDEPDVFHEMEEKILFDPHRVLGVCNKTVTVTPTTGSLLSMIAEEDTAQMGVTYSTTSVCHKSNGQLQKTFNIAEKTLSDDCIKKTFIKSPVRLSAAKKPISESMQELRFGTEKSKTFKFNQGSMPNLSENAASELKSIESNRYFYQEAGSRNDLYLLAPDSPNSSVISSVSTISTLSRMNDFNENEIRAQSSRFNVNDTGRLTTTATTIYEFFGQSHTSSRESSPNEKARQSAAYGRCSLQTLGAKRVRETEVSSPTLSRRNKITKTSTMAISPPSRSKIMLDLAENSMGNGKQIRSSNWNFKQPKKLKLSFKPEKPIKQLVLKKSVSLTPINMLQRDERIILYDAEMHLKGLINPDPFAATTTCDPFLASTMYLDEQTIDSHEMQFKKWLNALVTIPPELDSDPDQKIDLGKLFNEVRNKELKLAPTKELVCSKYYRTRLDCLRKSAILLFTGEEMTQPLSKVALQVEKKLISVRDDRNLHLDLVLQREILQLLLCFNPLWLRIGLEVTFGEQLEMQSNADVVGLSTFIINRMFKDRYLEAKYAKAYVYSSTYSEQIKKFMLKKFLFLILFLDWAKQRHIIKQNPCLFVKTSPYKETKDILNQFSSRLLANVGDIGKHLRRLGYVLSHKQTYLDEYNFAFKNLAIDLRDGVRLTKLMEVILLREDLAASLRVPAISRLQKVHNVDLALKALAEADFLLTGDITARDIADGHREKTLSLLWQIIYKFRAPKFNAAATTIQLWWRHINLRVEINRRIREKKTIRENAAATRLQAYFKGIVTRKYFRIFRAERLQACVCMQKNMRMWAAARRYRTMQGKIVCIQRWYRSVKMMRVNRDEFVTKRRAATKLQLWYRRQMLARKLLAATPLIQGLKKRAALEHKSAIVLQRCLKSFMIHRKLQDTVMGIVRFRRRQREKGYNATKIQSFVRMVKTRREFLLIRKSTIVIQTHWRRYSLARREHREYQELRLTTIFVQRYFRAKFAMKKQRAEYVRERRAIINVQQRFRAKKAMVVNRDVYGKLKIATVCLQQRWRATLAMRRETEKFAKLKSATLIIQRRFRAKQEMQRQLLSYKSLKTAAICLQQRLRAIKAMREQRARYQMLKESAIVIQNRFRANLRMKKERATFLRLKQATIVVQERFRAKKTMRIQQLEYERILTASIRIQQTFRAWTAMKVQLQIYQQLRENVICMQRRRRATALAQTSRKNYLALRSAAAILQTRYRARLAMRREVEHYQKLRESTVWVQQRWRANQVCRHQRSAFLKLKASALTIQRRWRAVKAMRYQRVEFLTLQYNTTVVQRIFRANQSMQQQRQQYLKLRLAVMTVQRQFRAKISGRRTRAEFLAIKQATVCLQRRFRARLAMQRERSSFERLKRVTIAMQRRIRATQLMQREQAEYKHKLASVIRLQRQVRAYLAMRVQKTNFDALKCACLCLQAQWRARVAMKRAKVEFDLLKTAVIVVQRRFRAQLLMRQQRDRFLELKTATIVYQRRFRAKIAMQIQRHSYLELRQAALIVQRRFRANRMARHGQDHFTVVRKSVICIQSNFRAFVLMKHERQCYQQLRTATITLQTQMRAYWAGKRQRDEYVTLKTAAQCLQTRYRAMLTMRVCRTSFLKLRTSTVTIQQHYRAVLMMRQERSAYLRLKITTITVQRRWRAQVTMLRQRNAYLRLRKSVVAVQRLYRAQLAMRNTRLLYLSYRQTVVFVQQRFRARRAMREQRKRFLEQREAALCIQQRFRALRLMRVERVKYLTQQAAATRIQWWVRSFRAMREQRGRYEQLRATVVRVQRRYREKLAAHKQFERYQALKKSVLGLQTHIRGLQARIRYQAKLTPEMILLRKKNKAAKRIQAMWRGYIHRVKLQTKTMRAISNKIQEAKRNREPTATISHQLKVSLKFLRGTYNLSEALSVLRRLENISRTVPHLLIDHAAFVANFCYGLMAQAIRSEADKPLIELCACIILNLARYSGTKVEAFQANGLRTIAQMLLRWCDKECGIFNTMCTLVWIFSHSTKENEIIRDYMTTYEAIYMLRETKKLVERKEKMKKNVKRPYGCIVPPNAAQMKQLPAVEPDYGVIRQKPYVFYSSVFAFDKVLEALSINL